MKKWFPGTVRGHFFIDFGHRFGIILKALREFLASFNHYFQYRCSDCFSDDFNGRPKVGNQSRFLTSISYIGFRLLAVFGLAIGTQDRFKYPKSSQMILKVSPNWYFSALRFRSDFFLASRCFWDRPDVENQQFSCRGVSIFISCSRCEKNGSRGLPGVTFSLILDTALALF